MRAWLARRLGNAARRLERASPADGETTDSGADAEVDIDTQRLIHKEVKERAARLDAATARLDTKAATLLGFVSAACIFLATQNVSGWWKAGTYAAWAGTVAFGLMTMRVRKWKEVPEPEPLQRLLASRSEAAALSLLTKAQVQAFTTNRRIHERKATHWRLSLGFLVAAVLLTAAAITLGGNNNGKQQQRPAPAGSAGPSTGVTSAAVR
nr:hypothetical protein [uncultured Actinoplanes sp.]